MEALGIPGERCVMVEDSCENLRTAKQLGMKTVLIGQPQHHNFIDAHLDRPADIAPLVKAWSSGSGS
jgi:putative hydrolase of the HAD superfamily